MRLTIPIQGTVIKYDKKTGEVNGHPDDPVKPPDIDLGNVSWRMVGIDPDAGTMDIEVTPATHTEEVVTTKTGLFSKATETVNRRELTTNERQQLLDHAAEVVKNIDRSKMKPLIRKDKQTG